MKQTDIAIAVVVRDGQLLVLPAQGEGFWKLPGIVPEPDESPEHALLREAGHAWNLEIEIDQALPPFAHEHPDEIRTLHPFLCRCVNEGQSEGSQWIGAQELADHPFDADSTPLIPWLEEHLGNVEEEVQRQYELDALRIRQVVRARQAATRAGSYCLIATLACAVAAIDLIWRAVRRYALLHAPLRPALYLLAAILLIMWSRYLAIKTIELKRQAQHRSLPEPALPPDFSSLSDGSHVVRNLERMQ